MRANTGLLAWGLFFIVAGGLILAVNEGRLERETLGEAWRLWPLILIGIGIGVLLRDSPFGVLGGLLAAVVLGGIAAAAFTGGSGGLDCGPAGEEATTPFTREGEMRARMVVDFSCGELVVATRDGTSWRLEGREPGRRPPRETSGAESVRLAPPAGGSLPFLGEGGRRAWRLVLPAAAPVRELRISASAATASLDLGGLATGRLGVSLNAADATLDLREAAVERLEVDANASATRLLLPRRGLAAGAVEANAGALELCLPDGPAIELTARGALSDTDFTEAGLRRSGERWRSPDFDAAAARILLSVEANAATVEVRPAEECT